MNKIKVIYITVAIFSIALSILLVKILNNRVELNSITQTTSRIQPVERVLLYGKAHYIIKVDEQEFLITSYGIYPLQSDEK